jgi:peptidoglycan/LPS O-acetylase OafA/YrhL
LKLTHKILNNLNSRFHSIDALRFFAFFKVFLLHIPLQGETMPVFKLLKRGGGIGVLFFFVLSGFLITYILVKEKSTSQGLDIGRFLRNRALRIMPLFFLVVLFALFFPEPWASTLGFRMIGGGYEPNIWTSLTFLENYQMIMQNNSPRNTPLIVFWSLCIEEHFYLLWCLMTGFISLKYLPKILLGLWFAAPLFRLLYAHYLPNNTMEDNDLFTNIDLFAAGGILGFFIATKHDWLSEKINQISVFYQYTYIAFLIFYIIFEKEITAFLGLTHILKPNVFAALFTLLIAIFVVKNGRLKISNTNIFSQLGKMSYGLYVFHLIFLHSFFQYCLKHNILLDNPLNVFSFMLLTFTASLALSWLSYHYFEMPILKFKKILKV